MGVKPSLTLELDSHTADAGVNTRIEAFLDIIDRFRELDKKGLISEKKQIFQPIEIINKKKDIYVLRDQEEISIKDSRVKVILPSMGKISSEALSAVFRSMGVVCEAMPVPTNHTLALGRSNTTCKECLPLILTTGTMIEYLFKRDPEEISLFFMPHSNGPCRQGQYHVLQHQLIGKLEIRNAGVMTLDLNAYRSLGVRFLLCGWISIIGSDYFEDIKSVLKVLAKDKDGAMKIFDHEFGSFIKSLESADIPLIMRTLKEISKNLSKIPLRKTLEEAKFITLTGEIYVRREEFSRLDLVDILERNGFVVLVTPASEYIYYVNYLGKKHAPVRNIGLKERAISHLVDKVERTFEKRIKKILSSSGLAHFEMIEVEKTIEHARHLISEQMFGEAILTTGASLRDIISRTCGVISIGPFACMPSRVAEAILSKSMNLREKEKLSGKKHDIEINELPFLAIETDGNPYPQIIQSKLEIFMLQADRLNERIKQKRTKS